MKNKIIIISLIILFVVNLYFLKWLTIQPTNWHLPLDISWAIIVECLDGVILFIKAITWLVSREIDITF